MTHDSLTFGLAIVGFGMLAADAARRSRGRRSAAWTRATAAVVGAHVVCVWAFRFGWSLEVMQRKGIAVAVLFHGAFAALLTAAVVREPWRTTCVWLAFAVVCLGALPAPFRYDEIAVLRLPVLAIAGAAVWTICRRRRRPVTR